MSSHTQTHINKTCLLNKQNYNKYKQNCKIYGKYSIQNTYIHIHVKKIHTHTHECLQFYI